MEKIMNSFDQFGDLMRSFALTSSPSLDDLQIQHIRQTLRPTADNFRILLNVGLFQPDEVEIHVLENKVIEIQAKHNKRQNMEGLWMMRDCKYIYELPPDVCGKELRAEWSKDHYLLIQSASKECDVDCQKVKLIPQQVQHVLKPVMDLRLVKQVIEDIRDRAHQMLRYIRFNTNLDTEVKMSKQNDLVSDDESAKNIEDNSPSKSTDGLRTSRQNGS